LRLAEEHHYRLDRRARNFRLQRTQTVALLFPYLGESQRLLSDPFYLEITGAISDELSLRGYDLLIARVPSYQEEWCYRYISDKRVDGVLLIDRALHDAGLAALQQLGAPCVAWGGPVPSQQDTIVVGCDGVAAAKSAMAHLLALGRRRIGFIGGNQGMVEVALRYQGYQEALAEAGLPLEAGRVAFTDFTPQAAATALRGLLAYDPALDAMFVCSDFMSVAVLETLRALGRRVPQDVSLVGYDDIPLAAYCTPRLTTIHQPIHDGGRLMVAKLLDQLEGRPTESALLPFQLIVRDSCGAI
jgi:DNA-binding LacI/PurR family transcriptional regulator